MKTNNQSFQGCQKCSLTPLPQSPKPPKLPKLIGPPGPPGPQGPQGPPGTNTLTTYGDAGTLALITPVLNMDIPLMTMFVSSNTSLVNNRIVVPAAGVYEIAYSVNVLLSGTQFILGATLYLVLSINGVDISQSRTRFESVTQGTAIIPIVTTVMSKSILIELNANDEISIRPSFLQLSTGSALELSDPNLKVIKIDD